MTPRHRRHVPRRIRRATPPRHSTGPMLPVRPSPAALAEAVALVAGRAYGAVSLDPSGDVTAPDLVRALLNIATALLLEEFPDDRGEAFLRTLGAEAVGHGGQD